MVLEFGKDVLDMTQKALVLKLKEKDELCLIKIKEKFSSKDTSFARSRISLFHSLFIYVFASDKGLI